MAGHNPSDTFPKPFIQQARAGTRSHHFDGLSGRDAGFPPAPLSRFSNIQELGQLVVKPGVVGNQSEWEYLHHGNQPT